MDIQSENRETSPEQLLQSRLQLPRLKPIRPSALYLKDPAAVRSSPMLQAPNEPPSPKMTSASERTSPVRPELPPLVALDRYARSKSLQGSKFQLSNPTGHSKLTRKVSGDHGLTVRKSMERIHEHRVGLSNLDLEGILHGRYHNKPNRILKNANLQGKGASVPKLSLQSIESRPPATTKSVAKTEAETGAGRSTKQHLRTVSTQFLRDVEQIVSPTSLLHFGEADREQDYEQGRQDSAMLSPERRNANPLSMPADPADEADYLRQMRRASKESSLSAVLPPRSRQASFETEERLSMHGKGHGHPIETDWVGRWKWTVGTVLCLLRWVAAVSPFSANPASIEELLQRCVAAHQASVPDRPEECPDGPEQLAVVADSYIQQCKTAARIRCLLEAPREYQPRGRLAELQKLMQTLPAFACLPNSTQHTILELMEFVHVDRDTRIIAKDQDATQLYFVLNGVCAITHSADRPYVDDAPIEYRAGDAVGEFAMSIRRERRRTTVQSRTAVDMVAVQIPEFIAAFTDTNSVSVLERVSQTADKLRSMQALQQCHPLMLRKLALVSQVVTIESPGQVVVQCGLEARNKLYFITKGQCKGQRWVPFVRSKPKGSGSQKQATAGPLRPFYCNQKVPDNEELMFENLSFGNLQAGEHFPRLVVLQSELNPLRTQGIAKSKITFALNTLLSLRTQSQSFLRLLNDTGPMSSSIPSAMPETEETFAGLDMSFVSLQRVELIQIDRLDLLNIADEETIYSLLENKGCLGTPLETLQMEFTKKLAWEEIRREAGHSEHLLV
ncbi:uncharacterized protein BJ171DRAFT_471196 [Polychytrium aggregatum]|uniref:uncharacterized protein n=1 Tax=Polychytrium aggregatum TaxID=110093 RepID=UPI0022FE6EDF|nr:uncharacterized protein BJ171DRAFT_471196 [Polychytrium aggregatum]KAI9208843.1 hypothetical protein BJ171DRAFT_471196 [Polychytrium aggregatum]